MPSKLTVVFFVFLQLTQNIGCYAECHCRKQSENFAAETVNEALKYGAVAGVSLAAAPVLLAAAGFTAAGITVGSLAAGFQSVWFGGTINGISGWMFAGLQSAGTGLGLIGKTAVITSTVKLYDSITGEECNC